MAEDETTGVGEDNDEIPAPEKSNWEVLMERLQGQFGDKNMGGIDLLGLFPFLMGGGSGGGSNNSGIPGAGNNFGGNPASFTDLNMDSIIEQLGPAADFLTNLRGNRGGGGGGGGGNRAQTSGDILAAQDYVTNLLSGGASFDPNLMGDYQGVFDQLSDPNRLAEFEALLGGNDLIREILGPQGALGGGGSLGGNYGFVGGGGGGGFKGPDVSLRDLPPSVVEKLNSLRDRELQQFDTFKQDQTDQLLVDLFGKGTQRSTVAGEAANRSNAYVADQLAQLESSAIQRELDLMSEESERRLKGDIAAMGANAQVQSASISASGAAFSAARALDAARLNATASIFGSRASALASGFASTTGGLTSALGNQTDLLLGDMRSQIDLGNISASLLENMRSNDAAIRSARIGANASMQNNFFNTLLGVGQLGSEEANRRQIFDLTREGFDVDRWTALLNATTQKDVAGMNKAGSMEKILALMALMKSDRSLKENIEYFDTSAVKPTPEGLDILNKLLKLRPASYTYIKEEEIPGTSYGIIAQDVIDHFPSAIESREDGKLLVRYDFLLTLALGALHLLINQEGEVN